MYILNERGQSVIGMPVVPISRFIRSDRLYAKDLAKYYGFTGCHSGSMYRASAKKVGIWSEGSLDYFFTLSLVADGGYAAYIHEPFGVYRYFSHENTITRADGDVLVGRAKLSLMESYLVSHPELAKAFSAQCLFELLLRLYFRHPLKLAYLKMLFRCRSIPSASDLLLIARVFNANRNRALVERFSEGDEMLYTA
jgi:hypothetical protein